DIRFGLNYGFPEGKVAFNGFFPADGQSLRYHRQWFRQCDGQWEVAEEITLTMPPSVPDGDQWQVAVKGEHVRREAGQEKRAAIDEKLTYTRTEGSSLYVLHRPKGRLPFSLFPHLKGKQLEAAVQTVGPHSPFGYLRGFNPSLASLTEQE
ncbi:MAG: hypothetical protein JNM56_21560, partial [Planctomycetia bacterium]|nr:hypothetical protein [Planctomycetia bacterium]